MDGDHQEEIVGDFGALGVWLYDHPNWTCLTDLNPEALLIQDHDGDGVDELVGDFGIQWAKPEFSGLWLWDGGALTHLNWNNAVKIISANTDARPDMEIVGTYLDVFGASLGFWNCDGVDWIQLNPLSPETFAAGDFDADGIDEVVGDFGALGLWFKDGDVLDAADGIQRRERRVGQYQVGRRAVAGRLVNRVAGEREKEIPERQHCPWAKGRFSV